MDDEDRAVTRGEDGASIRDEDLFAADECADEAFLGKARFHERAAAGGSACLQDDLGGLDAGAFEVGDRDDAALSDVAQDFTGSEDVGGECDVDADLLHEEGILAPYDAHDGLPRAEVLISEDRKSVV